MGNDHPKRSGTWIIVALAVLAIPAVLIAVMVVLQSGDASCAMTSRPSTAAPILTIVVLVMLLLYLGSYLLLVWPDRLRYSLLDSRWEVFPKYRYGTHWWAGRLYWPLEQIDRKIRPEEWQREMEP